MTLQAQEAAVHAHHTGVCVSPRFEKQSGMGDGGPAEVQAAFPLTACLNTQARVLACDVPADSISEALRPPATWQNV